MVLQGLHYTVFRMQLKGKQKLLDFDKQLPEAKDGIRFNLQNNVWGTNFMMSFGEDMKYRFTFKE